MKVSMKKSRARVFLAMLVLGGFAGTGMSDIMCAPVAVYAETENVTDGSVDGEDIQVEDAVAESESEVQVATDAATGQQVEIRPFTFRDWFGLVFCCALGIGICLWVALYGDPKERERLKNKKIRKQLEEEAKMKAIRDEIKRKEAEAAAQAEAEEKERTAK